MIFEKTFFLKFCFIFITYLLISCNKNNYLIGKYESKKNIKNKITALYVTGTSLSLNSDSTYNLTNCGNVSSGIWKIKNDSVILICKKNEFRSDSMKKTTPNLKCGIDYFKIINLNQLYQIVDSNYNGYMIISVLEKSKN